MFRRPLLALGLAVAIVLTASTSEAAKPTIKPIPTKKKGKKKEHVHHGVIEKVSLNAGSTSSPGKERIGSVTIKEHHHKKKGKGKGTEVSKEQTFKIEKHTKVEREGKPVKDEELHKGEHVIIHSHDGVADKIDIVHHKHKKKAKTKKKPV